MSNYIEIPATCKSGSTPILINLDKIITIKRYISDLNSTQALLSFRYDEEKTIIVEFNNSQIRDEYYEKIKRLLVNEL